MSSSSDSDISISDLSWIQQFERLCYSEDLSLDELQRMTEGISLNELHNSSFLHKVCMNNKVTLEIVDYLLELYPQAINCCTDILYDDEESDHYFIGDVNSAYPLHVACYNEQCPNEVIQLLLAKSSTFHLLHVCYMNFDWDKTGIIIHHQIGGGGGIWNTTKAHGGLPLHYYLSRTSNGSLDIVKQLVKNARTLLLADDETKCTPIHILLHNESIGDMFNVVKYLAETNPDSLKAKDEYGQTPLDVACSSNKNITVEITELLLNVCPSSIHQRNCVSGLCGEGNKGIDDEVAIGILKLLLEAYPDSVMQTDDDGEDNEQLPLHRAVTNKSQTFCKILVDAYPESVTRESYNGSLPFHNACGCNGRPETVEYIYGLYPESINIRDNGGYLPIHCAAFNPGKNTAEIVNFLLRHDPECLSKPIVSDDEGNDYIQGNGALPLHVVCSQWNQSNEVAEIIFDYYPEAILLRNGKDQLPIDLLREKLDEYHFRGTFNEKYPHNEKWYQRLQYLIRFLQTQMSYARKAQDETAMRTPDNNGLLPLHTAIRDRAPLGSIKLLVKGYPGAVNVPDGNNGRHPLNNACQL